MEHGCMVMREAPSIASTIRYKAPFAPANEKRYEHNRAMLKGEPVRLDAKRRSSVERSIRETCTIRKWLLHTVSVRTNHVHVVVSMDQGNRTPRSMHSRQMPRVK